MLRSVEHPTSDRGRKGWIFGEEGEKGRRDEGEMDGFETEMEPEKKMILGIIRQRVPTECGKDLVSWSIR